MNALSLQYFLAVVKYKSITRAAETLYVSQQNVSNHISRLETEFNVVLFERKPYFQLTYAGEQLVIAAQKILETEKQLSLMMNDIAEEKAGHLRIGVTPTRAPSFLPRILPKFHRRYPNIALEVKVDVTDHLTGLLERGEIDVFVGFVSSKQSNHIKTFSLEREELCLVVPQAYLVEKYRDGYPEALERFQSEIMLSEFHDADFLLHVPGSWTREVSDRYLMSQNFSPNVLLECSDMPTLVSLAANGMGITFAFESLAKLYLGTKLGTEDGAFVFPITTIQTEDTVVIGYNKNRYLTTATSDFMKMALDLRELDH